MRVLTTAINQGEHKVPEGHKCTRYALAPGEAMRLTEPRAVIKIDAAMAKRAHYLYLLSWLDGRTVAEFSLDDVVVAQPTVDDPKERRKRGDKTGEVRDDGEGGHGEDQGAPHQPGGGGERAEARHGSHEGAGDAPARARGRSRRRARLPASLPSEGPSPEGVEAAPQAATRRPRKRKHLTLEPL